MQNLISNKPPRLFELLLKLLLRALGKNRRYVMRAVTRLGRFVATAAEAQRYGSAACPAHIAGLARLQSLFPHPATKALHRAADFVEIALNYALQAIDPSFAPILKMRGRKQPDAAKNIDGAHIVLTRQSRFGGPHNPCFQIP